MVTLTLMFFVLAWAPRDLIGPTWSSHQKGSLKRSFLSHYVITTTASYDGTISEPKPKLLLTDLGDNINILNILTTASWRRQCSFHNPTRIVTKLESLRGRIYKKHERQIKISNVVSIIIGIWKANIKGSMMLDWIYCLRRVLLTR